MIKTCCGLTESPADPLISHLHASTSGVEDSLCWVIMNRLDQLCYVRVHMHRGRTGRKGSAGALTQDRM